MKKRNKIIFTVVILVSLGLVVGGGSLLAKILNKTVATVNGEIILLNDFEEKVDTFLKELGVDRETVLKDEPEKFKELKDQILDEIIKEKLILQEAETEKIFVTSKEVNDGIENLKSMYPSPEEFTKELAAKGISEIELKNEVKKQLVAQKLLQQVVIPEVVPPTENEIEEFYKENKKEVHDALRQQIVNLKIEKKKEKWIKKLRDKASIVINESK